MVKTPNDKKLKKGTTKLKDINGEYNRNDEELYKIDQLSTAIFNISGVGITIADKDKKLIMINDRIAQMFGMTKNEFLKRTPQDRIPPEDIEISSKRIESLFRGETDYYQIEKRCIHKDGSIFWVDLSMSAIRDINGNTIAVIGMYIDITDRKQTEEALKESEQKFRSLAEQSIDVIVVTDADGNISYISPSAERLFGFKTDEMVGHHFMEFLHKSSIPIAMQEFQKSIEEGLWMKNLQLLMRRNDDSYFHGEITGSVVNFESSKASMVIVRDISERKHAEEEQKKLQIQLINALEIAHLGPWEYDAAHDLFIFNDHFFKIFHTSVEELGGYTMSSAEYAKRFVHPDDIHIISEEVRKSNETNDPNYNRQLEHRIIYADGTIGWITVRFFVVKDADGKTIGTYGVNQDITDRKKAEDALKESEEFSASLLEHSPNAILVFDPDTSIRYVNPLFEKLTGHTSDEVLGKKAPYPWWTDEPGSGTTEQGEEGVLKGIYGVEKCFRKKNGDYFWIELNITPIYRDRELKYSLSTWTDITERKKAEEEKANLQERLQRSEKMESMGLLAGGVAHDLNNVLAGIVSYPELLLTDLPEDSKLRKPIETIEESGQRAVSIVQDLLTIARGVATTKEPLNLNDLIKDYLESPECKKLKQYHPAVEIETNLDSALLNVNGSPVHLRKALMNLVSNASEAIEGLGNITISTVNSYVDRALKLYDDIKIGEYAVLSVSDNGQGISLVDLDRIFEPFYTKKILGRSGTGLGLTVVWNVIKEHEGYLNVSSDEGGTTFDLYLPITRGEVLDKDFVISIEALKGKGERILVVDDIESQRVITCSILEKLDYKAVSVSSGEAAVEYIKENGVDLILLDMIMDPGINGRETYERITRIQPGKKAIIVSGFAETDDVKAAQKLGAGKYIRKPLTLQEVGLAIKEELEKH